MALGIGSTSYEWEFASRGGTLSQGATYSGGNDLDEVAWYEDNSEGGACDYSNTRSTWPVGQKTANELGLHDMNGNVWEWCWDWSPMHVGSRRKMHGGSWSSVSGACWVGASTGNSPDLDSSSVGFRAVLPAGP